MIYNSIVIFLVLFYYKYHNVRKLIVIDFFNCLIFFKYRFYFLNGKKNMNKVSVILPIIYQLSQLCHGEMSNVLPEGKTEDTGRCVP